MAPAAVRDSVGNLPAELTSFVGRSRELSDAKALLASTRLLTLTGMGGVGKTRLARRLVADVHRAFPDGVWQVELAELHEPALVAASIAASLGLHDPQGWTIAKLQESLAGRHLLLLIDNCEHLIDACAVTVDALLRACPELHVVATSRQPLAIDGEQILTVAPLPALDPERMRDLSQLGHFDAARLFVERASAVVPGFVINGRNQRAVAELCHRLDGLPLALEFAALRVRALSPDQIVARLDQDFRLSASGSRIAPSRQQTLHALVDWSYQLCSVPERLLWCRLAVFVGSFELEAADSVRAGTPIADVDLVGLVVGLVEKSVLVCEDVDGTARYRMAEAIRDYGRERLAESEEEERAARRAHRDWCVTVTARAYDAFAGPDALSWFSRLRREHGDIRAALECSLTEHDGAPAAADMLTAVLDYWFAFGFLTEARHWLDRLLLKASEPGLPRARALRGVAYVMAIQGGESTPLIEEARVLARQAEDERELGWIAHIASVAAGTAGELSAATRLLEEAVPLMRGAGDLHGLVVALGNRVVVHALAGEAVAAERRWSEFLQVAEPVGERWVRSYALWALGIAAWNAGDPDRAAELERASLAMRLPFNDRMGMLLCVEVLAWIAARRDDVHTAAILLGAAQEASDALGIDVRTIAYLVEEHERCAAQLIGALGATGFEADLRRGAELRADEVFELASGAKRPRDAPAGGAPSGPASPLTRREQEIAELVGQGISNKEIASRLVIAPRTAEGHVERILVKLGFTSRAQIAAWVAERRVAGS